MRQKQQIKPSAFVNHHVTEALFDHRLGPKADHTALFTGSPNHQAKRMSLGRTTSFGSVSSNKSTHPALSSSKSQSRRSKKSTSNQEANNEETQAPRKYRPGTTALREIRKYQKGTELLLQKAPFQRVVREVTSELTDSTTRFTSDALQCLQTASEAFVIQIFEDSVLAMIHAKRVTLMARDIQFIRRLRGI